MPSPAPDDWCGWCSVMLGTKLFQLARQSAAQTMGLRVAVVGFNLTTMLGLAGLLGFETFGQLSVLWGASLVAGTVLSIGGPVILLRMLTDGEGLRGRDICKLSVLYPAVLALLVGLVVAAVLPDWPWAAILSAGLGANALGCVASVMRALGSIQVSMVVRDAGPQMALGFASVLSLGARADAVLMTCAVLMGVLASAGVLWAWRQGRMDAILTTRARAFGCMALWANSVLGMIVAQIDLIVGGAVISAEQLGVYAVLRRLANLVALPVSVATWVSAPAVSSAHGARDANGLNRASAQGSKIAMLPGVVLCAVGFMALPVLPFIIPQPTGTAGVMAVLLLGAMGQVVFASSFTVATLCDMPAAAMRARLLMIALYLLWFQWWGPELTLLSNAFGYATALTLGGVALWWTVKRQLGVDTSCAVLLNTKGGRWKIS